MWIDIKYAPKDGTSILAKVDGFLPSVVEWIEYEGREKWTIDPELFIEEEHFREYWESTWYEPTHFIFLEQLD